MVLLGTVKELAQRILGGAYRIQLEAGGPAATLQAALQDVPGVVKVSHLAANSYALEAKQDLRAEAARAWWKPAASYGR